MNKAILFAALTLLSGVFAQQNCRFIADVVFVLDRSGSIGGNWSNVLNFVKDIINALDVDAAKERVRVGVVTFDTTSTVRIPLNGYTDKPNLVAQVLAISGPGGFTNVQQGLISGWDVMRSGLSTGNSPGNTRPGIMDNQVPRIIFLFGDGNANRGSTNLALLTSLGNEIKNGMFDGSQDSSTWNTDTNNGPLPYPVMIFSVFIGSASAGMTLFQALASSPLSMWFRSFDNFGAVDPTALTEQFCDTGGVVFGDVHFATHDGVMYTFNGAGDYIYMKTNDKIDIHVRDVYVGRATALAAMAISDKKTGSVMELWWDGASSERLAVNVRHAGRKNKVVSVSREIQVHHPFHVYQIDDGMIKIKHAEYPGFELNARYGGRASFGAKIPKDWKTAGLGGNNNENTEDDICNRSGKCVTVNATNAEVHKIGLDWAVLPSELLFEKWMPIQDWEIRYHPLDLNAEQLLAAKKVCGDVQPCIYDYISTGSEEYAKHTKNDYYAHILNEGKLVYVGDKF